jgi:multidrug efflux pump subunit AcrA (membrane-fusion protein)
MTTPPPDLRQRALDRQPPAAMPARHRRRWLSRYVVPGVILLGFAALLVIAAGRQLLPVQDVTVVPVITRRSEQLQSGTVLFQAAGWIEPRPTAVRVAALTSGVVEELLVVEGQVVTKDEPVAKLIAADAQLLVEPAKATVELRESELAGAMADQLAAQSRLDNPVPIQTELSDASNALAKTTTEIDKLPFLIQSAKATAEFARRNLESKESAAAAIPEVILNQARLAVQAADAELAELHARAESPE